jgi:hypothetical protein
VLAKLQGGPQTVGQLKDHALVETLYRPPHARVVIQGLLRDGTVQRDPARGNLTDATLIRLAAGTPAIEELQPATLF